MGANDKAAATNVGYVPSVEVLRAEWIHSLGPKASETNKLHAGAAFDRAISKIRAEAKAEALLETAADTEASAKEYAKTSLDLTGDDNTRYAAYANMGNAIACRLRNRAEQYKEEQ